MFLRARLELLVPVTARRIWRDLPSSLTGERTFDLASAQAAAQAQAVLLVGIFVY